VEVEETGAAGGLEASQAEQSGNTAPPEITTQGHGPAHARPNRCIFPIYLLLPTHLFFLRVKFCLMKGLQRPETYGRIRLTLCYDGGLM